MAMTHSPVRTRSQAATSIPAEGTLEAVLLQLQQLREERRQESREQQRFRSEMEARLQERDVALSCLEQRLLQLSPSENVSSCESAGGAMRELHGSRAEERASGDGRTASALKLKPDTFDGTAPWREYLSQFLLIASANQWSEAERAVVLASCLRGKARALLDLCDNGNDTLTFADLRSKLELRFGEGELAQNFYSQFTNRKQCSGEDFASLGADLERLSRKAYPECSLEVREKIACSQFIAALSDGFVKRTLQVEGISSLRVAIERAKTLKLA
ncbi:uncharacterized protein LOC116840729 [Odontomachus brunneus]|uniref:uncharacterized protein LOC116840729 n=1 Tax=Odontomachus brunneus TaxID=486640 RepID=UPI0013F1921A|nr:uncharacterized protein LOC116840729 [Odontomachus brunneus]